MIDKKNIIIIGATTRNVGKTEFVCNLISRVAAESPVYGLKISAVEYENGKCDHCDGTKCEVCSSLEGTFEIIEESKADLKSPENNGFSGKDTQRMLHAGADKVYWLKVKNNYFAEGAEKLLSMIPDNVCVVCESNSLRQIVKPGVFVVIAQKGLKEMKPSCEQVIKHADRIITFNGDSWDFQPDTITFNKNEWRL